MSGPTREDAQQQWLPQYRLRFNSINSQAESGICIIRSQYIYILKHQNFVKQCFFFIIAAGNKKFLDELNDEPSPLPSKNERADLLRLNAQASTDSGKTTIDANKSVICLSPHLVNNSIVFSIVGK